MTSSDQKYSLGIDLGTSSVKVLLLRPDGTVAGQGAAGYPVEHPHPGWSETDPGAWWAAVVAAAGQARVGVPGTAVAAIGLSGQMHGLVATTAAGHPVRPALLWSDARAGSQAAAYRSLPQSALTRLANPVFPGMAGPMLTWLADEEPEHYRRARWMLSPKDWLRLRLTGLVAAEPSDASATLLYDIPGDGWNLDVADRLGLDSDKLAPLLPGAGAPAGTLAPGPAAELGLPAGIPVAAGAGDTAAAALGSGLIRPGDTQLSVGTGVQIVSLTDRLPLRLPAAPVTHLYRTATDHGWYRMAAVLNGGATLDWVRRLFGADWPELYGAAEQPGRQDDPLFLPHLYGERSPFVDPGLRASWAYLEPRHDRRTLLRSALEGVALTTAAAWRALPPGPGPGPVPIRSVRLAGGGTAAPAWRQMLCDALDVELIPAGVPAASARGAAPLGGRVAGWWTEAELTAGSGDPPTFGETVRPDPAGVALLAERGLRWERLRAAQRHAAASDSAD